MRLLRFLYSVAIYPFTFTKALFSLVWKWVWSWMVLAFWAPGLVLYLVLSWWTGQQG